MSSPVQRIQAACVDGRAQNPRYIQKQLTRLHDVLVENASTIRDAIRYESNNTIAEVEIEYYLALTSLKEQYASVNFEQVMIEEYSLANGKNSPARTVAAGIVYIIPSTYSMFYSIISPLSAAIAAGNCVLIELERTLSELKALLRKLLSTALDADTFAILEKKPDDAEFLSSTVQVFGTQTDETPAFNRVISPSASRVVAVIDRTAQVEEAARALVQARFSFQGRSPYAPDVVLVNEFRLNEFCTAAVRQVTSYLTEQVTANGNGSISKKGQRNLPGDSQQELEGEGSTVLVSGASGSIVLVKARNSPLLRRKIDKPLLLIQSISSLDDAIDLANTDGKPLLATYQFASPPAAKYLSQFIDAHVSCVNQIPVDLLVGPAAPLNSAVSLQSSSRYTRALFEVPRPQYIQFPERSHILQKLLLITGGSDDNTIWQKIRHEAQTPLLPSMNQPDGKAVGFFEQGLMTGMAVLSTPIVTAVAVLGYYSVKAAMRRFR